MQVLLFKRKALPYFQGDLRVMYYHFSEYIYVAQFRNVYILLNTKADKYVVCLEPATKILTELFEKNFPDPNNQPTSSFGKDSHASALIEKYLNNGFIVEKDIPYPFYIDRKPTSTGVSNVDWRLPLINKKLRFNLSVLHAFFTLVKVYFFIKMKGLHSTIQMIKSSKKDKKQYHIPQEQELENLANILNKACRLYPTRTKCLEWAMTYVLMALNRSWKCNLEIGVQNYPFMAHAWVECDEKIVMDSQELRQSMAIILNEPFRKLKK